MVSCNAPRSCSDYLRRAPLEYQKSYWHTMADSFSDNIVLDIATPYSEKDRVRERAIDTFGSTYTSTSRSTDQVL